MKARGFLNITLLAALAVLLLGPGAAYCVQDNDSATGASSAVGVGGAGQELKLVQTGGVIRIVVDDSRAGTVSSSPRLPEVSPSPISSSGIVPIDNIDIGTSLEPQINIVSIDNISYEKSYTHKGEIRIAASEELVNLPPETPKANEAAQKPAVPEVGGSVDEALKTGSPVEARSTAILQAPSTTPYYNRLGGTVSPVITNHINVIHHHIISTIPAMQSAGIGTSMMVCGPPSASPSSLAFDRNFLTKNSITSQVSPEVPYLRGFFVLETWRALP